MMISAQTDPTAQEHLLEKYMALPNQVWDSIISQATQVSTTYISPYNLISLLLLPIGRSIVGGQMGHYPQLCV